MNLKGGEIKLTYLVPSLLVKAMFVESATTYDYEKLSVLSNFVSNHWVIIITVAKLR